MIVVMKLIIAPSSTPAITAASATTSANTFAAAAVAVDDVISAVDGFSAAYITMRDVRELV